MSNSTMIYILILVDISYTYVEFLTDVLITDTIYKRCQCSHLDALIITGGITGSKIFVFKPCVYSG